MSPHSFGLMIGGVMLRSFEIPEAVRFGGQQQVVVHRLPGGGRVIDCMGHDTQDVTWSGMMIGPDAAERARLLESLCYSAAVTQLLFGDMGYQVVVAAFNADYRCANWIGRYRIRCVTVDQGSEPNLSIGSLLNQDLSLAGAFDPSGVLPGVASGLSLAQAMLTNASPLSAGGAAQDAFGAALSDCANTVKMCRSGAGSALAQVSVSDSVSPTTLPDAVRISEILAKATVLTGLIGRAYSNFQEAG